MPLPYWYILSTLIPWYIRKASNGLDAASIILWPPDTTFKHLHPLVYMGGLWFDFDSMCKSFHRICNHTLPVSFSQHVFFCADWDSVSVWRFSHICIEFVCFCWGFSNSHHVCSTSGLICHTSHLYETLQCGSLAWTQYKSFFHIQNSLTRFSCGTVWSVCWKHFFHWNIFRTLDIWYPLWWCS